MALYVAIVTGVLTANTATLALIGYAMKRSEDK